MENIENRKTSDYIAEQLADEILSGRISGNMPLRQEELADQLGASRIPVREALQILELQGLAVRLASRHIVTADLTDYKIRELYLMIGNIERNVIDSICRNNKKDELKKAIGGKLVTADKFHEVICRLADNEYLRKLLQNAITYYIQFAVRCSGQKTDMLEQVKNQLLTDGEELENLLQSYYLELADCIIKERRKLK